MDLIKKELKRNWFQHVFMIVLYVALVHSLWTEYSTFDVIELSALRVLGFVVFGFGVLMKVTNDKMAVLEIARNVRSGEERLITDGMYKFSRNPCYLGQLVVLIGALLMSPNYIGLFALFGYFVAANRTIDVEQERLGRLYGEEYELYKSTVGRWISSPAQLSALFRSS